jgi:protein gp37
MLALKEGQMQDTNISWAQKSWNPVLGCSRLTSGCEKCYAEAISLRFRHTPLPWTAKNAAVDVQLKPHKLREPYALKTPSRIFVNSMSDLYHEQIPDAYIQRVFGVMIDCPQHTFMVLTKRSARMARWPGPWPTHIWQGVSIENRRELGRLDHLRACGAQVKFLSLEPLLEDLGKINLNGVSWIICGGESGPGYRTMEHAWARSILEQCLDAGVPMWFKQSAAIRTEMGTALRHEDDTYWTWQQLPGDVRPPEPALPHRWSGEIS